MEKEDNRRSAFDGADIVDTNIHLIGDKATICQITQLIAYLRNAIQNSKQVKMTVNVGSKVASGKLLFDVNGMEIPDLIAQDFIEIN